MPDDIDERLRAVERALTDAETPVAALSDAATVHERLDALDARLRDLTERVDALDATVQSLHGYVGELEAVNDRVERRADAARAAVERLEDEQLHNLDAEREGTRGEQEPTTDVDQATANQFDGGTRHEEAGDQATANPLGNGDDTRNAGRLWDSRHEGDTGRNGDSLLERVRNSL